MSSTLQRSLASLLLFLTLVPASHAQTQTGSWTDPPEDDDPDAVVITGGTS